VQTKKGSYLTPYITEREEHNMELIYEIPAVIGWSLVGLFAIMCLIGAMGIGAIIVERFKEEAEEDEI
jgi:hypothetical protein